jgi:hypothetical protein
LPADLPPIAASTDAGENSAQRIAQNRGTRTYRSGIFHSPRHRTNALVPAVDILYGLADVMIYAILKLPSTYDFAVFQRTSFNSLTTGRNVVHDPRGSGMASAFGRHVVLPLGFSRKGGKGCTFVCFGGWQ